MRQAAVRYGGVEEHFAARMTRAQAMRLRTLSDEAQSGDRIGQFVLGGWPSKTRCLISDMC
jgi:hypothetical protein